LNKGHKTNRPVGKTKQPSDEADQPIDQDEDVPVLTLGHATIEEMSDDDPLDALHREIGALPQDSHLAKIFNLMLRVFSERK